MAAREITLARSQAPDASDFQLFAQVMQNLEPSLAAVSRGALKNATPAPDVMRKGFEAADCVFQLRLYLGLAFSDYHFAAERFSSSAGWPWVEFFRETKDRLLGVVSFNYDLNIETLLETLGRPMRHVGIYREPSGMNLLPIFKPHGSIDYRPDRNVIEWTHPHSFPPDVRFELSDMPLERARRQDIRGNRPASDLVLPSESSYYTGFRRVVAGRRWAAAAASRVEKLLILGILWTTLENWTVLPRWFPAIVAT